MVLKNIILSVVTFSFAVLSQEQRFCQPWTGPPLFNIPPATFEKAEKVFVFEHPNFQGDNQYFCGREDGGDGEGPTDVGYIDVKGVSSVKWININTKCVCFYELPHWAGGKRCFDTEDNYQKTLDGAINDNIGSISWSGNDCTSTI
ncbi:hypothetical protein BJ944DRAFT_263389 [Cunninghamella echinulata]|nr:hypothetical protein BJ944DRAFT_263389 [Cunninghamella echinulata]